MDAVLNFGAQPGGFIQKDVKPETGAIAPGRQIMGYEGSSKRDGEAMDFLAAISDQTAGTMDEAVDNIPVPDKLDSLPPKLQFRNSATLTIDDPDSESSEPLSKASAPLISGEIKSTQYELQDRAIVPTITDTNGGEKDGLEFGLSTPFITGNAKSEHREPLLQALAPVVVTDTDIDVTEQQSDAFAPLTTGDAKTELREPKPRAFAVSAASDTDSELREQQPGGSALLATGDAKTELPEPPPRDLAPLAIDDAETTPYALKPRAAVPVVLSDIQHRALVLGDESQVGRPQSVKLTIANRSATDDLTQPRQSFLSEAKTDVVQGGEASSPLKTQTATLGGLSQLALPDANKAVIEDSRVPEKQTQQSATLNDPSRIVQSRQTSPYLPAPVDRAASSVLITNNGEGVSGDLDLDLAVDFTSGRRYVGQAVSAPQTLTSPAATHAPVVGATAQIIAAIKANRRSDTIEIRLDPPELGRVKIDFTMETMDSVKAILSAERGETLDHMRRNIGELAAQLKDAGFKSMEFEFSKNSGHEFSKTTAMPETPNNDGGDTPSLGQEDIVYLSMRSDAQLDLLA